MLSTYNSGTSLTLCLSYDSPATARLLTPNTKQLLEAELSGRTLRISTNRGYPRGELRILRPSSSWFSFSDTESGASEHNYPGPRAADITRERA